MATRLPYAQGESGNVVIVRTCLDIARTSGRDCRASSVSGTKSSQFTRFSRTAWRSPRNAGSTCSESRGNFQIARLHPMALRQGYTVVSVRACSKFCVTFVKSQSLRKRCISSTRLLEFPNPMQISSLRVYMLWNHESHEPFEHRFEDGAVCWALLHKFLTKLLAWVVNLLCWQQQPAF